MNNSGSNSSSSNNGNNGNGGSDSVVAAVALVVSIVALLVAVMQALQQYYASAQGYSQCNEKVMGGWAKSKTRRFQWDELRFEVQFDAPVIFVSPPTNDKGPIKNVPICFLDGTKESLKKTWTVADMNTREEYSEKTARERIHTADNERASWFVLLYALQRMEKTSREWQEREYKGMGPPGELSSLYRLPQKPPSLQHHHTLTAAVQRKRKSWDTMPTAVTKPYATTTMCHLIEMMAALGVYWKEFDRRRDRYWAEGNGFMVLGERISDLGLMFSFQVSGKCKFEVNRVIPVDEIKELCFGHVSTIYREQNDERRLEDSSDLVQSLGLLVLGSRAEIAETLAVIGCNQKTVRYFSDENTTVSHLFPVSFEILGMLGRTFHIENSGFTYIPNPTPDIMDKRALSFRRMLVAYHSKVDEEPPTQGVKRNWVIIDCIKGHIASILCQESTQSTLHKYLFLRELRSALDDADEILTGKAKRRRSQDSSSSSLKDDDGTSRRASEKTIYVNMLQHRRKMVQSLLRHHLQEVLYLLNLQEPRFNDTQSMDYAGLMPGPPSIRGHDTSGVPAIRFEDMNIAGPEERQDTFMDIYFNVIREIVVSHAARPFGEPAPSVYGHEAAAGPSDHGGDTTQQHHDRGIEPDADVEKEGTPLAEQDVSYDDLWCTMVFRMMCWLMLHNIDKNDVQVNKSELLGSRMPVYVS